MSPDVLAGLSQASGLLVLLTTAVGVFIGLTVGMTPGMTISTDIIILLPVTFVHLETTAAAAGSGKHVFLDKSVANTIGEARAITKACSDAGVVLSVGYQRRRESHLRWIQEKIAAGDFGILVQAEANISRDRAGEFELGHWRYTVEGMPGGVMLQIGLHYVDVLTMLLGPIETVLGMAPQLVLPGDNPDLGSLMMKHENGAVTTLSTSYGLGVRVVRDEHLRQEDECLLQSVQRAAVAEPGRHRPDAGGDREERRHRRTADRVGGCDLRRRRARGGWRERHDIAGRGEGGHQVGGGGPPRAGGGDPRVRRLIDVLTARIGGETNVRENRGCADRRRHDGNLRHPS